MYTIRKSIDLDFSHHVRGHDGACINVHGHTWKFEVDIQARELDARGFVVDFSALSRGVLRPCHSLLDHALAIGRATWDEIREPLTTMGAQLLASRAQSRPPADADAVPLDLPGVRLELPGGMKVAVFDFDPSSERLARWLFDLAVARLATAGSDLCARGGSIAAGRVYETLHPVNAVAEYRP